MRKWYDTIEFPQGDLNISASEMTMPQFLDYTRQGAILNPHGDDFVVRLRKRTRQMLGLEIRQMIDTPIGRAMVLDR